MGTTSVRCGCIDTTSTTTVSHQINRLADPTELQVCDATPFNILYVREIVWSPSIHAAMLVDSGMRGIK